MQPTESGAAVRPQSTFTEEEIATWSPKRRDFLRILSATGGLAALGTLSACGESDAQTTPPGPVTTPTQADLLRVQLLSNAAFWTDVQSRFILNPQRLFMNIGTAGSMPRVVVDKFNADNTDYAVESRNGYSNFLTQRTAIARGTGALDGRGYGVDPDELVISYNTSDGMCQAIGGIQWERGDTVITTNQEHPGGDVPLAIARDRYGLIVRRIVLPVGPSVTAAQIEALFEAEIAAARTAGQRVRAIMWSSPTFLTGVMLPIRRIVNVAIRNSTPTNPIITICDGAHLPGMMAYNYAELGMDFMAGAGHKWQCAAGSTGILVIRNKVRPAANPLPLPAWFPVTTSGLGGTAPAALLTDGTSATSQKILAGTTAWSSRAGSASPTAPFDIGSIIQSCGSKHTPLIQSVAEACNLWDSLGRKNIETYVLTLAQYCKERIVEIWGSANGLYAPKDDPELRSALTSFDPFLGLPNGAAAIRSSTISGNLVTRLLNESNIVVRNTTVPVPAAGGAIENHFPIRISTHLWHDPADVDRVLAECRRIAISLAS